MSRTSTRAIEDRGTNRKKGQGSDQGFSLPELLIGVMLTGILTAVLSAALIAILRQGDNSEGRLNNARSESRVGFYLPADLASAQNDVDDNPLASPCYGACPVGVVIGGSNTLLLEWSTETSAGASTVITWHKVSYRYQQVGTEWQLIRIECTSTDNKVSTVKCEAVVVLHDLDGPPAGIPYAPGDSPYWIMTVSNPPSVDSTTGEPEDNGLTKKNASRVVVTINGGGNGVGALAGGSNQISLSAGGTDRQLIDATSLQGAPSLINARSRCGGNIILVIDESASISVSEFAFVKQGVQNFVNAFIGTPVKLKLVPFHSQARVLGNTATGYYDMLKQDQVDTLLTEISTNLSSKTATATTGRTNWEDAMLQTFYKSDGTIDPIQPDMVVFFTDGVPTNSRIQQSATPGIPIDPPARLLNYPAADLSNYNHEGFYRASVIAQRFRGLPDFRFIGVGVGGDINDTQAYITGLAGYHYDYIRKFNYSTRLRWYHIERSFHYEQGGSPVLGYSRGYHIQKKISGVWTTQITDAATLDSNTRVQFTQPYYFYRSVTSVMSSKAIADDATNWSTTRSDNKTNQTMFNAENNAALGNLGTDAIDEWQRPTTGYGTWTDISLSAYNAITDTAAKRITYEAPTSSSDSLAYWELDPTATQSTAPSSSRRLSFTAPFLFSKDVLSSMSSQPTAEGATSWSTLASSGTNTTVYTSQNNTALARSDNSDRWSETITYSNSGAYSEVSDGTGYPSGNGWVRTKVVSPPFTGWDPITTPRKSWSILGEIVSGSANGAIEPPKNPVTGKYVDLSAEDVDLSQVNLFVLPDWNDLSGALQRIALEECGGTLTLQTKFVSGTPAPDPFTYQKTAIWDFDGTPLTSDMTIVKTTKQFTSGTFVVSNKGGKIRTIEVQPFNLSDVSLYNPGTWKCRAGITILTPVLVNLPDSNWKGIRVPVGPNEAVSCTQTVSLK